MPAPTIPAWPSLQLEDATSAYQIRVAMEVPHHVQTGRGAVLEVAVRHQFLAGEGDVVVIRGRPSLVTVRHAP